MSCVTQNLESEKILLAAEILRAGGRICLRVLGTSMLPAVWPGDIIGIDALSADAVAPGEIVLYESIGRLFLHRVVGKTQISDALFLVTRGDSMPQNDAVIAKSQLLGRVSSIRRHARTITPKPQLSLAGKAIAWMVCYSTTFRNFVLRLHSYRARQDRDRQPTTVGLAEN